MLRRLDFVTSSLLRCLYAARIMLTEYYVFTLMSLTLLFSFIKWCYLFLGNYYDCCVMCNANRSLLTFQIHCSVYRLPRGNERLTCVWHEYVWLVNTEKYRRIEKSYECSCRRSHTPKDFSCKYWKVMIHIGMGSKEIAINLSAIQSNPMTRIIISLSLSFCSRS